MGRGKFKGKPTGRRHFSTPEEIEGKLTGRRHFSTRQEIVAGSSTLPRTFKQEEAEADEQKEDSEEESEEETGKRKGPQGLIQIENPNIMKPNSVKARDINIERTTELSRREREEIEKHEAHERFMQLQEQGKTEQSRKDLERLALVRKQRAESARKREEQKAAKEQKKMEARK